MWQRVDSRTRNTIMLDLALTNTVPLAYSGTVLFRQNQLRRPFVNSCRVLNTNPHANAYFIAFIIGEHAGLENWFIHFAFYTKLTSSSRLF